MIFLETIFYFITHEPSNTCFRKDMDGLVREKKSIIFAKQINVFHIKD